MRTLTAAITASCDSQSMTAIYVVEIKAGATVLGRWASYSAITDWDGSGNSATGYLAKIPEIRQDIDWRGGLGHYSEPNIDLADADVTLRAALQTSTDLDVEVWFLLKSGTIAKATQAIRIYRGIVGSFEVKDHDVRITAIDRRLRRYPSSLLEKVDLENTENFCGAGRKQSAVGTWDLTAWAAEEEWLPEETKGELIPIVFGKPTRARLLLSSKWPGGEDIVDTEDIRGPVLVASDCRLDYGATAQSLIDYMFRVDDDNDETWNVTGFNAIELNPYYSKNLPVVSICADSDDDNAWRTARSINTYARLGTAKQNDRAATVDGDWASLADKLEDDSHSLKLTATSAATLTEFEMFQAWLDAENFPGNAGLVRGVYYEAYAKNFGAALAAGLSLRVHMSRNPDWSGHTQEWLDSIAMLTPTVDAFNNWDWGTGSDTWADGAATFGGASPFGAAGALGNEQLSSFQSERMRVIIAANPGNVSNLSGLDLRVFGVYLIVCVDFALDKIKNRIGCAIRNSFDSIYWNLTSPAENCTAWETIYASLVKIFGASTTDDLVDDDDWTAAAFNAPAEDLRLDFQLTDDMSGRELLDEMAMQSGLWLVASDDGKEKPVFLNRKRNRGTDECAMAVDFDEDNIVGGSLSVAVGDEEDLFNRFRVRYGRDVFGGGYLHEIYVDETGGNCPTAGINTTVTAWCVASQAAYGVTRELVIDAWMIEDAASAETLLMTEASKLSRRPLRVSFSTSLTGMRWEIGDFPCVGHASLLAAVTKDTRTGTLDEVYMSHWAFIVLGTDFNIEVGDWVYATSADMITDDMDGWYRVTALTTITSPSDGLWIQVAVPAGTTGEYADCALTITPALMITGHGIRGHEVDIDLTEIAYRAT